MTDKEIHIEQLMIEKLAGDIGEKDELYLDALLSRDADAREQWQKLRVQFAESGANDYLYKLDKQAAWQQVRDGIDCKTQLRIKRRRRVMLAASFLVPIVAAFAFFYYSSTRETAVPTTASLSSNSVKLLVGGASAINLSQYKTPDRLTLPHNVNLHIGHGSLSFVPSSADMSYSLNTLVVPATVFYSITLSDGTEISLNSMSELRFAFSFGKDRREVWLKGEAYFKVAKDSHRQFVVHTPLTDITVLGTEFNVNTYDSSEVSTALVNGAVRTNEIGGKSISLEPGYEAIFSKKTGFGVKAFDSNDILSWQKGVYYFRDASLEDIASVIRRWYGDTLIFDGRESSSSRFTGAMLKEKPVTEFLENLASTSDIHYYMKNSDIHITVK